MSPFRSEKQRKFLFKNKPEIAAKFVKDTKGFKGLAERMSKLKRKNKLQ